MTASMFRLFYSVILLSIFAVLPNPAQQADSSFGSNGFVSINFSGINPFGPNDDRAVKLFNLPAGKILIVANHRHIAIKSGNKYNTMRLVRYTNAGVPDAPAGSNSGTIGSRDNFVATDAAIQPDGKIVIAGYTYQFPQMETGHDWVIARHNQDGTPDTVSGFEWIVTRAFGNNVDVINDVEIQADGKIVVLGTSYNQSIDTIVTVLARYNSDATPDSSFGPNGEAFFVIYDSGSVSKKLLVQPDGKFLLAGNSPSDGDAYVARYNADGSGATDPTFGSSGYVTLNYGNFETLNDLKLQPDGKILALVDSNGVGDETSVAARFNPDGSKDLSFTPNGAVFINTSPTFEVGGYETGRSLIVRGNGNILVTGESAQNVIGESFKRYLFTVLEYGASGQLLNKTFSRQTRREQVVSQSNRFIIEGSLEQPDGKILLYGAHGDGGFHGPPYNVALARYSSVSAVKNVNFFFDYNFNAVAEYAVYRPNRTGLGTWYFLDGTEYSSTDYGAPGDILTPGDYDGDMVQDLGVFRPTTGEWFTKRAYFNGCAGMNCPGTIQFGANGDIPAPGDFDGDGKTDRAVFRPSNGDWYILLSSGGVRGLHFGQNGDKPVVGDYDGDGKSDVAVIRRENGQMFWYILQSSNNQFVGLQFGITEDKTVVADYNGDAKTEIAVWRPSNGTWYVLANYANFSAVQFGSPGDIPEPADYDRDRKDDFAVFRPNGGVHYVLKSSNGTSVGVQFGASGDIPIASAYVR